MRLRVKARHQRFSVIVFAMLGLLSMTCFSKSGSIMTTDLLQSIRQNDPWDRDALSVEKAVMFNKTSGDATAILKITASYFTSVNCSGTGVGTNPGSNPLPSYTTPDGSSFAIITGTPFALVAASIWNVGHDKLNISNANMANIRSIAITFKSTNNSIPQAAFTNVTQVISYACIPVTCTAGPSGTCLSQSGTQNFTLKTTAAVGDPANGGVIGCLNGGLSNLVVTTSNQSEGQVWGGSGTAPGTTTGAISTSDGAANTATIVQCLTGPGGGSGCPQNIAQNTYAAGNCSLYSTNGGFVSGWFLPSGGNLPDTQIRCLYNNATPIAAGAIAAGGSGFSTSNYWSSTEGSATVAWRLSFFTGNPSINDGTKTNTYRVRCVRSV